MSFKIFTKVAVNRLTNVADKIIRPTQSAFMPRRHILEGVVVLNETLHELQQKNLMELHLVTPQKWTIFGPLHVCCSHG